MPSSTPGSKAGAESTVESRKGEPRAWPREAGRRPGRARANRTARTAEAGLNSRATRNRPTSGQDHAGRALGALEHRHDEADQHARQHGGRDRRGMRSMSRPNGLKAAARTISAARQQEGADRRLRDRRSRRRSGPRRESTRRSRSASGGARSDSRLVAAMAEAEGGDPGRGLGSVCPHRLARPR